MKVALTIAGSDSGGGAGIQTDLHAFAAHGLHGTSALTAVTAQNTTGVTAWAPIDPALVEAQIDAVAQDMPVAAAKTGMLPSAAVIEAVVRAIRRNRLESALVVDPVLVARSGDRLVDATAERACVELLLPLAAVATPNALEAEALLGRPVRDLEAQEAAARDLQALGPRAVLVKGGGIPGPSAVDVLFDGRELVRLAVERIDTPHTHGTGCTLSAAIAARLALGARLREAVEGAKDYLTTGLRRAYCVGRGRGCVRHHEVVAARRDSR